MREPARQRNGEADCVRNDKPLANVERAFPSSHPRCCTAAFYPSICTVVARGLRR